MTDIEDVREKQPARAETSMVRWLIETALLVLLAFALAQGIKTFLVQPFVIPTGSMIPTIEIGNRVLAEKLTFRFSRPPRYNDIVVFGDPKGQHPALIKRTIAVGGQTVDLQDGFVYVDGVKLDEPYTHGQRSDPLDSSITYPFRVPEGHIWVMGDNRTNSGDSRYFGPIALSAVQGHAVWTYWPPQAIGKLN